MFGNYYRNEKITYWFFSLLPIILVLMLAAYMQATSVIDGAGGDFLWCFFAPLAVGTGAILVALQFGSQVLFQIQLGKLIPQQKQHIRENGILRYVFQAGTSAKGYIWFISQS